MPDPTNLLLAVALAAAQPAAPPPLQVVAEPAATARTAAEADLLAADAHQRDAVANADLAAIRALAHPNLRVNAPNNRILSRDQLIAMVGAGEIRNEQFERVPEQVTITGDVGVVMGRELVYPGAGSEQARMYGRRMLERRYTNIYLRERGAWRHLARHANVVR